MSGKRGMKKYPVGIREEVVARIRAGESQCALSREFGAVHTLGRLFLRPARTRMTRAGGLHRLHRRVCAHTIASYCMHLSHPKCMHIA